MDRNRHRKDLNRRSRIAIGSRDRDLTTAEAEEEGEDEAIGFISSILQRALHRGVLDGTPQVGPRQHGQHPPQGAFPAPASLVISRIFR